MLVGLINFQGTNPIAQDPELERTEGATRGFQATVEYLRSCTTTTINIVVAYKKNKK
jgi:hypothetical protein